MLKDAAIIRQIAIDVNISIDSSEETGFVEYPIPDEEEYLQMIKKSKYFYVAESDKKIVGFLSGFTYEYLQTHLDKEDELEQFLLKKNRDFIYLDQLAVIKEYRRKGIGKKLIQQLITDSIKEGYKTFIAVVCCREGKQNYSVNLLQSLDFKLIGEKTISNGLKFEIYKKRADGRTRTCGERDL